MKGVNIWRDAFKSRLFWMTNSEGLRHMIGNYFLDLYDDDKGTAKIFINERYYWYKPAPLSEAALVAKGSKPLTFHIWEWQKDFVDELSRHFNVSVSTIIRDIVLKFNKKIELGSNFF